MKLVRKTVESASDVVGHIMVTRCHQHCGGAADSVHRQSGGHPECAEYGDFYCHERLVCPEARDVRIELVPWIEQQR